MKVIKFALSALGLLALLGVGGFFYLGQSSQSGTAPGLVDGRLAPCPASPNCASSEAGTETEKLVEPLAAESWEALPDAVAALGGTVTVSEEEYLAAEFTSATFGFVDDLEFRKAETVIHVRSASRVGYSDAGVNAERVGALRERLTN